MKIKLTLRGRTREDIDLLVTTDATATVGDVAAALASSGPRQSAATLAAPDSLTLRVLDPVDGRITSVLPSTAYVTETGLNSGSLVDIASAKDATPTGGVAGYASWTEMTRACASPCISAAQPWADLPRARSCSTTVECRRNMLASPSAQALKFTTSTQPTVSSLATSACSRPQ